MGSCVDTLVVQQGSSIQALVENAMGPDDRNLAPYFDFCRRITSAPPKKNYARTLGRRGGKEGARVEACKED